MLETTINEKDILPPEVLISKLKRLNNNYQIWQEKGIIKEELGKVKRALVMADKYITKPEIQNLADSVHHVYFPFLYS